MKAVVVSGNMGGGIQAWCGGMGHGRKRAVVPLGFISRPACWACITEAAARYNGGQQGQRKLERPHFRVLLLRRLYAQIKFKFLWAELLVEPVCAGAVEISFSTVAFVLGALQVRRRLKAVM